MTQLRPQQPEGMVKEEKLHTMQRETDNQRANKKNKQTHFLLSISFFLSFSRRGRVEFGPIARGAIVFFAVVRVLMRNGRNERIGGVGISQEGANR